jgi:5-methylcytosine-specific restriction protein A
MATYLLTWNPARWSWDNLQECIETVKTQGYHLDSWSSGVTKKIRPDDRVFLIKLGDEPRGIVASGWATSKVYEDRHWDKSARAKGKIALYFDVHFDTILDPDKQIFPRAWLNDSIYAKMHWEPQASGTTIPDDVAAKLEKDWAQFVNHPAPFKPVAFAEEADVSKTYSEGTTKQVMVNVYERSAEVRTICINRYGLNCSVCSFNFEKTYGEIGEGFIHVHHLKPLAEIGKGYKLNPIKDLRPVCPNCHAMLHQKKPAYSIEELKTIIKQAAQ